MKNLRLVLCCVSLSLYCMHASAQQPNFPNKESDEKKPELFHQQPEKVSVDQTRISTLISAAVGDQVVLNLQDFLFEGNVIAAVSKYNNAIQSVVVRSTNYPSATLTLSRVTDESGKISYTGRIISMKHGDVYQLKAAEDGGLALVKEKFNRLVVE